MAKPSSLAVSGTAISFCPSSSFVLVLVLVLVLVVLLALLVLLILVLLVLLQSPWAGWCSAKRCRC